MTYLKFYFFTCDHVYLLLLTSTFNYDDLIKCGTQYPKSLVYKIYISHVT
jgi:hypothetical protein